MQALDNQNELASFTPYPIKQRPVAIELGDDSLTLQWDDGHHSEFHYLWLRDNCQCSQCVTYLTREQVFEICDAPLTIKPVKASLSDEHRLVIEWDHEQHISQFHPGWLRAHCYSESSLAEKQWVPKIWDKASITQELATYQYHNVMQSDAELLNWLRDLNEYGLTLIQQVDTAPETVVKVANRISFIRETNFGTVFNVRAKMNTNSAAYTDLRLPLHTDLPTRELQPGLQFLHCLVNDATGGESILVNGFKIAKHMQENYPEDFHNLSSIPMSFGYKRTQSRAFPT
ncbi:TauD/TfdA family dioxygenase [Marinomonas sp. 2405UD68-3]|uniref:TauD/TfdA family dioxygenase n=1 Tax=Marinomonas sp. 2405UD68-3 TaxID=3391835 RepID=UPI0039C90862